MLARLVCLLVLIPLLGYSQNRDVYSKSKEDSIRQQYYALLDSYKKGRLDENTLFTTEHISLISQFIQRADDIGFKLFYRHPGKIDKIMRQPGYARRYLDYVIAREEIDIRLWKNGEAITSNPDWEQMTKIITRKYNARYADRTVFDAKIRWYETIKDSATLARYYVERIDRNGLDTTGMEKFGLNNMIYYFLFRHSNDTAYLNKGIKWMEMLIKVYPDNAAFLDTYANLLYKTGREREALEWEKKAFTLDPKNMETRDAWYKMKKGEPTWLDR